MINKLRLYWNLQVWGWSIYAMIQVLATVFASGHNSISASRTIFFIYETVLCLAISHAYRYFIKRWDWVSLNMERLIGRIVLSVFVLGLIMSFLRIPGAVQLGLFNFEKALSLIFILGQSLFYAIIFFLWSTLYFIYNYFDRYNTSLKMQATVKGIELSNLKAQLNPHFIFNAMNTIRALVDDNPDKSKEAITKLSNILRNSLSTEKGLTKFEDEIKIVKDYLSIESMRFEERLHVDYEIATGSNNFWVPPFMIQTLVENGIKHGISQLPEGGIIKVRTILTGGGGLKIQIYSSGLYTEKRKGGLGLTNTTQRLNLLYGDAAYIRIKQVNNNFVLTEVKIPHLYNL